MIENQEVGIEEKGGTAWSGTRLCKKSESV